MSVAVSIVLYVEVDPSLSDVLAALAAQTTSVEVAVHLNVGDIKDLDPLAVPPGLRLTRSASANNIGFAEGQNRLLARAFDEGATAVVVHNPDVVLEPEAVGELVAAAAALRAPGLLGPVLELADPGTYESESCIDTLGIRWTRTARHLDIGQGTALPRLPGNPMRVAGVSGACMLVTREAYDAVVGRTGEFFDEDFIAFREDAELGFRAALVGIPSYVVPAARGLHARSNRGTTRGRSEHIDRLGVRNRFLIAFKYGVHRPGGVVGPFLRDVVVITGVLLRERSSLPGLREAWALRHHMREKGRRVLRNAVVSSRDAARLRL